MRTPRPIDLPQPHHRKAYLGDGAFVREGSFRGEIVLTTEDGINIQNEVVLEPSLVDALFAWVAARLIPSEDGT